jgi:glycosyltransferase involved in cell wall biosynthesis
MNELVSVIIPSYQRYDLLIKAIDSVYKQTYKPIEIIVVNDCSTDYRYDDLKNDNRIKYISLNERLGYPGKVRNVGIKESKGNWVSFLDDDDFWVENKLERQMSFSSDYDFISCDAFIDNERYFKKIYLNYWVNINPQNSNLLDYNILSKHNLIMNSTVLLKKDILYDVGLYDETTRNGEDYATWLKITSKNIPCFFLDEPLVNYNDKTYKYYSDKLN